MFGFGSKKSAPLSRVEPIDAEFPMPQAEINRLRARRWILENLPKGGVGAEIGVFRGHFSAVICTELAPKRLYLIDPWRLCGPHFGWGTDYTNNNTLTTQAAYEQTLARMARFAQAETVVIEGFDPACDDQIPEMLDFACLDASHTHGDTLAELRCLQRRVKPGGFLLGDDWRPDPRAVHHGVYRAIQDFVREGDWEVLAAGPGGQWALRRAADRQGAR